MPSKKQLFVRHRKFQLKGRVSSIQAQLSGIILYEEYFTPVELQKLKEAWRIVSHIKVMYNANTKNLENKL